MHHDRIGVVDFGGQYAHLIATKVRRLHVLAEICQPDDPVEALESYQGLILSGSPAMVSQGQQQAVHERLLQLPVPILGLCFGHQQIARHYGGHIEHARREYGPARLRLDGSHVLFTGLPTELTVWMSHGDSVTSLPRGFLEIGTTINPDGSLHRYAAIADDERRRYGLQFHPEVDDTECGDQILSNFVLEVCGCIPSWTMRQYLHEQLEQIRAQVGDRGVFLLVSGGVDSTVCAVLLARAIGPERLHLLHIDNGLMRKNESDTVLSELHALGLDCNVHFRDASNEFVRALAGVIDPEQKRRIIGDTFVRIFELEAARLQLSSMMLGQGTIYPDTIETGGTRRAEVIKTHHNRVPLIEQMIARNQVIEPLKELYKTEVRELGQQLGIDPKLLWRHPFPGPGLGVRLLCSDGTVPAHPEASVAQQQIDDVAQAAGLHGKLLPVRSVGVKGDVRSYEHPVLLWGPATHAQLLAVASWLYRTVTGINRCLWDLTGRGMRRVQPQPAQVTQARLELLRQADDVVMRALERHGLMRDIWQCPTVLLPLAVDDRGTEVVIVRPVHSERAMTARPAQLPAPVVAELCDQIMSLPSVGGLWLDVTTKPPGTIEWE